MTSDATDNEESGRLVPVAWEALEDAFENNAPEVHSYLNLDSGEVIRIVDGVAEPQMHARIVADATYMRVEPVSSREQYRWMERYIATVEDAEFRQRLVSAIDGKGAFRRFKDVLMHFPVDRERWFTFRSERLRIAMEGWLEAHGISAAERKIWDVPPADDAEEATTEESVAAAPPVPEARPSRVIAADATRKRLHESVDLLPVRELDMAAEFLEFLRERRPVPRVEAKSVEGSSGDVSAAKDTGE